MPYRVHFNSEQNVIETDRTGTMTFDEIVASAKEAVELSREKGVRRYLCDDTHASPDITTVQIYEIPKMYASLRSESSSGARIAVLLGRDSSFLKDYCFYETTARNQGFEVKLFYEREAAYAWLSA